ncbi:cytochrome P450 [Jatrophihabitans sp. GAS493]|uniref:cytochrome P450 n=1 Tax=Jatrophihabitans sp. GAS493 TaxID=1907575 RepID=UPI000BB761E8|nr:cytochrome P450 [Jatrophihabitans sp. GAS493]SOD73144.1 cytochrome P450 [Jatrophihabitans sp. GAS493]
MSDCPHSTPVPVNFDHNDQALTEDNLWQAYADLQSTGRVTYSQRYGGFYILSHYDDVKAALRDHDTFVSGLGHRIPTVSEGRDVPIDFDPPVHTSYRKPMAAAVTPTRVRALEPFLRGVARDLVQAFVAQGGGDVVSAISLPLPLRALTQVAGFSDDTIEGLHKATEEMWAQVYDADFDDAYAGIKALMDAEVARHRAEDLGDYSNALLDTTVIDGAPVSDDLAARMLMSLAIAGHETTLNAASSLFWLLANDLESQDKLRADPGLAPQYVEEVLRLRAPIHQFGRRTSKDVVVDGVLIPAGSQVLVAYASANRDAEKFDRPDEFDPDRASRAHLTFGWGIHQCLGAPLVRAELKVLLETLCEFPRFLPAGEVTWGPLKGGAHYGPAHLPLQFEEAK